MPYFDHNATTPLASVAREAWLRVQEENWHNPSSPTRAAARAKIRLDSYHEALAVLLGGEPARYVFNSGATEGAHAVLGHWAARLPASARIAVAPTEHPCVLAAAGRFFAGRIDWLPHGAGGVVSSDTVRAALAAGTAGCAGGEQRDRRASALATQWLCKLPGAGLGSSGAWVIASGHKCGAPKGVGFVKLPEGHAEPDFGSQGGGPRRAGIAPARRMWRGSRPSLPRW